MSEYLVNESDIVQVADAIRAKSETTEPISFPQGFVNAITGIQSGGEDTLKKLLDATKSCYYMFLSSELTSFVGLIPFQSTSCVTSMVSMFARSKKLTTIPLFDTSSVTSMNYMFEECSSLTTIPLFDTSSVTTMHNMFFGCSSLTTIPLFDTSSVTTMYGMFDSCARLTTIPSLDMSMVMNLNNTFSRCYKLTECWIRNIRVDLTVGSGSSYGHLLTVESLVHLINELRNTGSSHILTVGSVNLEKLANVYVKTIEITDEMRAEDKYIDQKSPCVVCESTDEGATLITDYANTKHWTIR